MCGIVGMIAGEATGFDQKHISIFENMLLVDTLRGKDSTGVFSVDKTSGDVMVMKGASHATNFLADTKYDSLENHMYQKAGVVFGHNRAATRGATTDDNAHPFHEGNIVLIHNGTLTSFWDLKAGRQDITVDSHAIAYALSKDSWQNVLPKIDGAFMLVWIDMAQNKLFIASNGERPLYFSMTSSKVLLFASEYPMIGLASSRNGIKLVADKEGYCFTPVDKNTVLEFDLNKKEYGDRVVPTIHSFQKEERSFLPAVQHSGTTTQAKHKTVLPADIPKKVIFEVTDTDYSSNSHCWILGEVMNPVTFSGEKVRAMMRYKGNTWVDHSEGDLFEGEVTGFSRKNEEITLFVNVETLVKYDINPVETINVPYVYRDINGRQFSKDDTAEWTYGCDCGHCSMPMTHKDYVEGVVELSPTYPNEPVKLLCADCSEYLTKATGTC